MYTGTKLQKDIAGFLAKHASHRNGSPPSNFSSFEKTSCFGSLCPSTFNKTENVMELLEKFVPDLDSREPASDADDYRVLPEALWREYPETMRALLDSGILKLSDLADWRVQLDTIRHLKFRGNWKDFPMLLKFAVFFGSEDRLSLIDAEEKVREDMERKSLEAFKVEALCWEAQKRLQRLKKEAREQALKEFYRPKSKGEFYREIFSHKIQELMKNE